MMTSFKLNQKVIKTMCLIGTVFFMCEQLMAQDSRVRKDSEDVMLEMARVSNQLKGTRISSKDVEKFVPLDIQAGSNTNQVAAKVADRSLQTWFKSDAVQSSVIGQTANTVQNNMKMDASMKSSEIEHKFTMQLMALQTSAKLEYSGYLNASLVHNAGNHETDLQLSEKIFSDKKLYVNHLMKPADQVSSLGVTWLF